MEEKPMTRAEIEALVRAEVKKEVDKLRSEIPDIVKRDTANRMRGMSP